MREDLADLGVAAAAVDARHQVAEPLGLRHPARGAAFGRARGNRRAGRRARRSRAASRNMSACSRQAVSQVGCRLMVASSAKISRPRVPAGGGGAERAHLRQKRVDLGARRRRRLGSARPSARCRLDRSSCRDRMPSQALRPAITRHWPIRWHLGAPGAMALVSRRDGSVDDQVVGLRAACPARRTTRRAPPRGAGRARRSAASAPRSARITSCRAVTCDRFGRVPSVASSRLSSAVSPRGKNSR